MRGVLKEHLLIQTAFVCGLEVDVTALGREVSGSHFAKSAFLPLLYRCKKRVPISPLVYAVLEFFPVLILNGFGQVALNGWRSQDRRVVG